MKQSKLAIITAFATVIFSQTTFAKAYYDDARVIRANPVYEYVQVRQPVQQCEVIQRPRRHHSGAEVLVGAVVGGVIGHAIGNNDASAVAGAVIGGSLSHQASHGRSTTTERCYTRYEKSKKVRKIKGYNVKYRYNGEIYRSFVKHHPGDFIKVRVTVGPAGYN
jgi:uncharacterized protein YcfJ